MLSATLMALSLLLGGTGPGSAALTQLPITGTATFYHPPLMNTVYNNRLRWGQVQPCPYCTDNVSMIDCADLGRKVYIARSENQCDQEGPFLVVDCAPDSEKRSHEAVHHALEVSYEQALRWGMSGPITVIVSESKISCNLAVKPPVKINALE